MLLLLKHKVKKALDRVITTSFSRVNSSSKDYQMPPLSWYEYFKGGFEFYPEDVIESKMNQTWSNKYYTLLRQNSTTKILGIWDDNDFGVNDGKADNPIKHK